MKNVFILSVLTIILVALVSTLGCARGKQAQEDPVLAYVDGEAITANDIATADSSLDMAGSRLLSSHKQAEKLDLLIERRSMIHQATKLNLHKTPEFVKAIQKYWEYTLISKMLDQKKKEIEGTVTVSEKELDGYVQKMQRRIKYRTSTFKNKADADKFMAICMTAKGTALGDERVMSDCEELATPLADELMQMKDGEIKVIGRDGEFIVAKMISKENVPTAEGLPPREELRKYALEMKRAAALDNWIAEVIAGAKVEKIK